MPTLTKSSNRDRKITEGLLVNSPIARLTVPVVISGLNADITDVQCIGSYNWLDEPLERSIIVPGSPPEWLNRKTPYDVKEDSEQHFVDQNGFKIPSAPLLPLIASVDFHHASPQINKLFNWSSVEIITDRNGLRKLLRWVRGEDEGDFRIDLQLAGKKTVLFDRWEKSSKDYPLFPGTFGHNYEGASTRIARGCAGSTGHHRVIQYNFGGLKMVVRCETDAYLPAPRNQQLAVNSAMGGAVRVSTGKTALHVHGAGIIVPQDSTVELKTISLKRLNSGRLRTDDTMLQMLLSQTPHLVMGVHNYGTFIETRHKVIDLKEAEVQYKPSLLKLRAVLEDIKKLVVAHGEGGRLSLLCRGGRLDVVRRSSQQSCLPPGFLERFR